MQRWKMHTRLLYLFRFFCFCILILLLLAEHLLRQLFPVALKRIRLQETNQIHQVNDFMFHGYTFIVIDYYFFNNQLLHVAIIFITGCNHFITWF